MLIDFELGKCHSYGSSVFNTEGFEGKCPQCKKSFVSCRGHFPDSCPHCTHGELHRLKEHQRCNTCEGLANYEPWWSEATGKCPTCQGSSFHHIVF